MGYKTWNRRTFGPFREEFENDENSGDDSSRPSVQDFQKEGIYDKETRRKLVAYLGKCDGMVASTLFRTNIYTKEQVADFVLYTDGEVIFDNLILEYIQYDDFVLPERWFAIIQSKDFRLPNFKLDFDKIRNGEINIFKSPPQTFDEKSIIQKAMIDIDISI